MDTDSVWQEEESWVEDITVEYYKNLFMFSNPTNFSKIVQAVQKKGNSKHEPESHKGL